MTQQLRADLIRLDDHRWRLISQTGSCCTIQNPPASWVEGLQQRAHGYQNRLDTDLENKLATHSFMSPDRQSMGVVLIGGGLLAAETALGLAQAGFSVQLSAPEAACVAIDPLGTWTSAAAAIQAWVGQRLPNANLTIAQHWTGLTSGCAELVVVATGTVQPDRAITDHLGRQWLPYLVVRAQHSTAVVGPLVGHQDGPCQACLDLALADHDDLWPRTLAGLTVKTAHPDAVTARWAGGQAALEASWYLNGAGTTLESSTIEISADQAGIARRRWARHADCACGAELGQAMTLPQAA